MSPLTTLDSDVDLQAEFALALNDDFAVLRAQFDFSDVSARAVNLLGDQSRAFRAAARYALRHVSASMDANLLSARDRIQPARWSVSGFGECWVRSATDGALGRKRDGATQLSRAKPSSSFRMKI